MTLASTNERIPAHLAEVQDVADTIPESAKDVREAVWSLSIAIADASSKITEAVTHLEAAREFADTDSLRRANVADFSSRNIQAASKEIAAVKAELDAVRDDSDDSADIEEKVRAVAASSSEKINAVETMISQVWTYVEGARRAAGPQDLRKDADRLRKQIEAAEATIPQIRINIEGVRAAADTVANRMRDSDGNATRLSMAGIAADRWVADVRGRLKTSKVAVDRIAHRDEKVREAADLARSTVKDAKKKTYAANAHAIRLRAFVDAKEKTEAVERVLLRTIHHIEEVRKALTEAKRNAEQVAGLDRHQ